MYLTSISTIIIYAFWGLSLVVLLYAAIVSFNEGEGGAGKKLMAMALAAVPAGFVTGYYDYPGKMLVAVLLLAVCLLLLYFFLKKLLRAASQPPGLPRYVDELDTIFARMKLIPGTPAFDDYYKDHPYEAEQDAKARSLPGLLSKQSVYYNPLAGSTAYGNFRLIEYMQHAMKHPVNEEKTELPAGVLTAYLKNWCRHLGVHSCGITELKEHHLYTRKGRGEDKGKAIERRHAFAVVFTVEMHARHVQSAPATATTFESSQQYLNSTTIALQIDLFLKTLGYDSRAHIDGDYELICPVLARDAGLGEIGRMGLLMTPRLGPRVRIAAVTTNAPLLTDNYRPDPGTIAFCRFCKKCAECCPGQSIPFDDMKDHHGVTRWKINSESCFQYWCTSGTDCARCMSVCPFSHPDNLMHNSVRRLISRSETIARFAYLADDFLYGRKPKPREMPGWMLYK
jgi:reductive dehalogenase